MATLTKWLVLNRHYIVVMRPAWVASFISVTQADLSTSGVSLEGELEVTFYAGFLSPAGAPEGGSLQPSECLLKTHYRTLTMKISSWNYLLY